jgi:hypothetical protein
MVGEAQVMGALAAMTAVGGTISWDTLNDCVLLQPFTVFSAQKV